MTDNTTNTNTIILTTDGSCKTQTREGGWAAILQLDEHERVLQGFAEDTTSNAMEITAVIQGLSKLTQPGQTVHVRTDSKHVVKGVTEWMPTWKANGWRNSKNKPVANQLLWEQIDLFLEIHTVTFEHIPRAENKRADDLAQAARTDKLQTDSKPPSVAEETRVYFAGSRNATAPMLEAAKAKVRAAHNKGYTILVGDNPRGVDRAVLQECNRLKAKVIVAGVGNYPRNGGCKHGSYVKVDRYLYRATGGGRLSGYTVRDRYLADNAQYGVFYWNGRSPGTKAAYDYMAANRPENAFLVPLKPQPARA